MRTVQESRSIPEVQESCGTEMICRSRSISVVQGNCGIEMIRRSRSVPGPEIRNGDH